MQNANFDSVIMKNANASFANLTGAELSNANLTGVDFANATLTGVTYNEATVFPSGGTYDAPAWGLDGGISPWDAGMIPAPEPSVISLLTAGVATLIGLARVKRNG